MSDIRDHYNLTLKERLTHVARTVATQHCGDHDYLPQTASAANEFEPHEWVIDAMMMAYQIGHHDGKQGLQRDLCMLIGAVKS